MIPFPDLTAYYNSREPNKDLMDAEIIKKISYPTGAYTLFTFEPHDYSSVIKQSNNIVLQSIGQNKIAGGLRIKKIETFETSQSTPLIKEYFYVGNYLNGSTISSGTLSGEPVYYEEGSFCCIGGQIKNFSSLPINYLNNTNGNHITYSCVIEKSGNGFTEYFYTNNDNGFLDKDAFVFHDIDASASSINRRKMFGKRNVERGMPLTTKYYALDNFLLKQITNTYNEDPNRFNSYVRSILAFGDSYMLWGAASYPIYTFYPYLKKQTVTEFSRNGSQLTITTDYTYDAQTFLLKTKSYKSSLGRVFKTTYKYPNDFVFVSTASENNETHDIAKLLLNNILNVPIETTISLINGDESESVLNSEVLFYENLLPEKKFTFESIDPVSLFKGAYINAQGFSIDNLYSEHTNYLKYDDRANLLETKIRESGISNSYIWGYKKSFPIAQVVNATRNEIGSIINLAQLETLSQSVDESQIRSIFSQLRLGLPNARIISYTYNAGIGITSQTDVNNVTTFYGYDKFGRLSYVKDNSGNLLKYYHYNYIKTKRISLSDNVLDFGNVPVNSFVTKTVRAFNSGDSPIEVRELSLPLSFTYSISSPILKPSSFLDINITFKPTIVSDYSSSAIVLSDGDGEKEIVLKAFGVSAKVINLSGSLIFNVTSSNPVGFPCSTRTMTIANTGSDPLTVSSIQVGIPFSVDWTSGTIPPGGNRNVNVKFCPINSGSFSTTINVISDKTSGGNVMEASGSAGLE